MKCLMKYNWVKLRRDELPGGKGIMNSWAKLASHAAFRKGQASYCGHINSVSPGMWSGGIVGLKSILGVKSRSQALETLEKLSKLGYLEYSLDENTKKLTYTITDWVIGCSGMACAQGTVYATNNHGFLCLPRNITQRLIDQNYIFEEADAWLDLWCHTVYEDPSNAFSFLAPSVQYGNGGALLTLEKMGQRWHWEKTKVWRFFKKHGDIFALYRLPGSFGCLIFNKRYPADTLVSLPEQSAVLQILSKIRALGADTNKRGTDHQHLNKLVALYSRYIAAQLLSEEAEDRVALFDCITRAYISLCWSCKNCEYDCRGNNHSPINLQETNKIRGPCCPVKMIEKEKEKFIYEQTG